jgi:serine phosphatase RsbU (regulator of sigma subunit)
MVKIANASLLSDLELQREQELAEARAIQIGMLPQGALRTADAAICYSFHPFHEVGGDFLDFFTLTDGAIGIGLCDVTGKGLPAELYAALAVGTLRGVHKTGAPPSSVSEGEFFGIESVLEVCESSRENSPEEILQQLTEAAVSYSCGRPQQDDRTAAILRYIGK